MQVSEFYSHLFLSQMKISFFLETGFVVLLCTKFLILSGFYVWKISIWNRTRTLVFFSFQVQLVAATRIILYIQVMQSRNLEEC